MEYFYQQVVEIHVHVGALASNIHVHCPPPKNI